MKLILMAALLVAFPVTPAFGQTTNVSVTTGYRYVDLSGHENTYRTLSDEDSGLLLENLAVSGRHVGSGWWDRYQLDAAGFGGAPDGWLRFKMEKGQTWKLDLRYRRNDWFSDHTATVALPEAAYGIPSLSRTVETVSLNLSFRTAKKFRPFVSGRLYRAEGPSRTRYHVGGHEYELAADLDFRETEYTLGFDFSTDRFEGSFSHGQRDGQDRQTLSLASSVLKPGSFGFPDRFLEQGERIDRGDTETPVTRLVFSGQPGAGFRLAGSFLHADAETEYDSREQVTGSLVTFHPLLFSSGRDETVKSSAKNTAWRGNLTVTRQLAATELRADYERGAREQDGRALMTTILLDAAVYGSSDGEDVLALIEADTLLERDEETFGVGLSGRVGSFVLRGSWSHNEETLETITDEAQIIIEGGQSGRFERTTETLRLGAAYRAKTVSFKADWRREDAENALFRNDYLDRDRLTCSASFSPVRWFRLRGRGSYSDFDNDRSGLDGTEKRHTIHLGLHPSSRSSIQLHAGAHTLDTQIQIRIPQDFRTETRSHEADGKEYSVSAEHRIGKVRLTGGFSRYENEGDFAFELNRYHLDGRWTLSQALDLILRLEENAYDESEQSIYEATGASVLVSWRR